MGLIPDDTIDEIRARADIVAVIGAHVQLRKAGVNHKGLCPFHQENTPSFNVNSAKGFFYCFGCQKKGDVFTFVMEYEGQSFIEAARTLAERFGVQIPEREMSAAEKRERSEQSRLFEINKIAARFFRDNLTDPVAGATARAYLEGRGISDDVTRQFGLGYAPDSWDAMVQHLARERVPVQLAEKVGLIKPRKQSSGYYDAFRNRLVCPVIMPGGEVAGFSGRRLGTEEEGGAKYINSPESSIYKKSRLLFGIHRARDAFRKAKRAILVEGNFDVISLHQHGFPESVAPLGTALTEWQVEALRRQADEVVLVYDGDKAGRAATLKALSVLVKARVPARVALLPEGEDPDTLVQTDEKRFETIVSKAKLGAEYFILELWSQSDKSAASRAALLGECAELFDNIDNPTQKNLLLDTLAGAMETDVGTVKRALLRRGPSQPRETTQAPAPRRRGPLPSAELEIIAILADHPTLLETAEQLEVFSLLTDGTLRDMYSAARQGQTVLSALPDDADPQIAKHVFAGAYASLTNPQRTLTEAVQQLRKQQQRTKLAELQRRAVEAGRRGEQELQRQLLKEIVTIRRQVD